MPPLRGRGRSNFVWVLVLLLARKLGACINFVETDTGLRERAADSSLHLPETALSKRGLYARDRAWLLCTQIPLPAAGAVGSAGMLPVREKRPGRGGAGVSPNLVPWRVLGWGGRVPGGNGAGGVCVCVCMNKLRKMDGRGEIMERMEEWAGRKG